MDDKKSADEFLKSMGMGKETKTEAPVPAQAEENRWDDIILPKSSYILTGDVGTGKSGMAYYIMERYSQKYGLTPVVVGVPSGKKSILPKNFKMLAKPDELTRESNVIAHIDEADIQLGIEDIKAREYVTNFLSLPRQRHQILLLTFHYPRLALSRYIPFFAAYMFKRPPYLIEFASKSKGDSLYKMMMKAEERFGELVPPGWKATAEQLQPLEVLRHTYVVAPRLRWEGMIANPTSTFWTQELSEVWAGAEINKKTTSSEPAPPAAGGQRDGKLISIDGKTEITLEMVERKVKLEDIHTPNGDNIVYLDPITNTQWIA